MNHPFLRGCRVLLAVCVSIVLLLQAVVDRPSYETYLSATQWGLMAVLWLVENQIVEQPTGETLRILRSPNAWFWTNNMWQKGAVAAQLRSAPSSCALTA
jgi:hypothetical protein